MGRILSFPRANLNIYILMRPVSEFFTSSQMWFTTFYSTHTADIHSCHKPKIKVKIGSYQAVKSAACGEARRAAVMLFNFSFLLTFLPQASTGVVVCGKRWLSLGFFCAFFFFGSSGFGFGYMLPYFASVKQWVWKTRWRAGLNKILHTWFFTKLRISAL